MTSAETVSTPLTPLKSDVECSFTTEKPLMEASNGSVFLPLLVILGLLGLKISWFPIRVGDTGVAKNVGIWQLTLDLVLEEEAPLGVVRSLPVPITFPVVRKCAHKGAPHGAGSNSLAQPPLRR